MQNMGYDTKDYVTKQEHSESADLDSLMETSLTAKSTCMAKFS